MVVYYSKEKGVGDFMDVNKLRIIVEKRDRWMAKEPDCEEFLAVMFKVDDSLVLFKVSNKSKKPPEEVLKRINQYISEAIHCNEIVNLNNVISSLRL